MGATQHNVLIVDDEEYIVRSLQHILKKEGYGVYSASNGLEALNLLKSLKPSLIILDIQMPDLDGFELCKKIKSDERTRSIPVILLTAQYLEVNDKITGLNLGADDYMTKPFNTRELLARVRAKIRILELTQTLKEHNQELQELSITDSLTGLFNRRFFDFHSTEELHIAAREGKSVACLMMDIDDFKRINDSFGHQAGDFLLKEIARILKSHFRRPSLLARYGGEEFVVLVSGLDIKSAEKRAEMIRKILQNQNFTYKNYEMAVTLSFGIATCPPIPYEAQKDLIDAADAALYEAKKRGKNRVEVLPAGALI